MPAIRQELRQFIIDNFLFGQADGSFRDDTSFLETGIIDSTGVLELITFLDERYAVKLEDEEIVPENLDSINNLVRFMDTKLQQRASAP